LLNPLAYKAIICSSIPVMRVWFFLIEPKAIMQRMLGGFLMGIGASFAGGCTITNSLVSTAYFSWQGWLATLMIMLGCWTATYFVKPTQCRI
ncbi:YeeE/YedE thiosulfate transporter family protein, partial [Glaesserella parasuis]|nr:YeeE/YedE thiosulfate transporter family protein [Glaesserella parasuis]MDO9772704.1 YeeE/YedE thiosulfate transporter family protein [Glaesserella parasuis]MDO9774788.1 YeeE/YedE thiosulfate transporter family protein [Glaesserella parasuis]MDO9804438.1 YeeE/YedE thiosulfate transporter family protein [Glaesserella parasuis]MDO9808687.1 YeeE/YedE thiosulfate transporter family protein [Glaesserella parasuis]